MGNGVGCVESQNQPWEGPGNCHDCNCPPGTYHHPGCDEERCHKCGYQAIACECYREDPKLLAVREEIELFFEEGYSDPDGLLDILWDFKNGYYD